MGKNGEERLEMLWKLSFTHSYIHSFPYSSHKYSLHPWIMADTMLGTKDIWVLGLGGKKYVQRFLGKSFIKIFFNKKNFFN